MPSVNKTASGLLLYEDFSTSSSMWIPSPNNYNEMQFGEDGLRMFHSDMYKTITIEEPQTNYSLICKLNHIPIDTKDIGGVIVMSNDTSYIECQSCVMTSPSYITNSSQLEQQILNFIDGIMAKYVEYSVVDDTGTYPEEIILNDEPTNGEEVIPGYVDMMYPYIKVIKINTSYTFLASTDGKAWIEVGNTKIPDANRIGFFLYSHDGDITNTNYFVEYAAFYSNNYVIVNNITNNQVLELRDSDGSLICDTSSEIVKRKNNQIFIDTTLLKMPYNDVKINVLQNNIIIYEYVIPQLVGGDIYAYSYDIKVCIDNVELNQEEIFDLGVFYHNDQAIRIDIYNQEAYALENLTISLSSFSVYFSGSETIGISLYDENETNYSFSDKVTIPLILPSEGKSVIIKLTDKIIQDFYKKAGIYRFKINIE